MNTIPLRGVRVHNLQSIDVDIPLGAFTVITGVSGAGKSSLAFDTLYAEAQRRYLQSFSAYTRQFLERFDRPDADTIGDLPPAIAVHARAQPRQGRATVGAVTEIDDYLRLLFARAARLVCPTCGQEVKASQADDVLDHLQSLPAGTRVGIAFPSSPESDLDAWRDTLREEGFLRLQIGARSVRLDEPWPADLLTVEQAWVLLDRVEVGKTTPERMLESIESAFQRGQGRLGLLSGSEERGFDQRRWCERCRVLYPPPEPQLLADPEVARAYRIGDKTLPELGDLRADAVQKFLENWPVPDDAGMRRLVEQVQLRLAYLEKLGLGYLALGRHAAGLSTGEAKRVRLAAALGSNLVGALYIFDEPTTGLHPRDIDKLLGELRRLKDAGNTLVAVEHSLQAIAAADHVIDLGPGAGADGGRVVYQGPASGQSPEPEESRNRTRRRPTGSLRLTGVNVHNLQNVTVEFPLGVLCVVTGVSGAGKTSLVRDALYPALTGARGPKLHGASQVGAVVLMDQEPPSASRRGNPATFLKIFDDVRKLFADTTEAKIRNFGPGDFSFNQPGGRCEHCQGQGQLEIDMQFLADVVITCPECLGKRFRRDILQVKVRNLDIAEVLDLTVREAFRFFRAQRLIEKRLKVLMDVGLDYLRLGQPLATLSGGEVQRLKLAGQLATARKPHTLFLLLEPAAGLHPADTEQLTACFDELLATGHSLIVVEHRLEVIRRADYLIDLGPGGGPDGGRVIATGTPEEVAQNPASVTGLIL